MKAHYALVLGFAALSLSSCAHHRDVRPGPEGVNHVVIHTDDTDAGERDAISQANDYCDQWKKQAVILQEGSKYTGSMDESNYRTAKTASKVAQAVGGAGYVFGGKNERTAGGIVGVGGGIADQALGNGYTVDMKFKCQ